MTNHYPLALDIDDTLADTARHIFQLAKSYFSHTLTVEELLFKYEEPSDVPEWQGQEMDLWLEKHLGNSQFISEVPMILESNTVLKRLTPNTQLGCYITSRQHYLRQVTAEWLQRHQFPPAPLFTRSPEVREKNWKIRALQGIFNQPTCLIDNSLGLMTNDMLTEHTGLLLWYNPHNMQPENTVVKSYSSWLEIENFITT